MVFTYCRCQRQRQQQSTGKRAEATTVSYSMSCGRRSRRGERVRFLRAPSSNTSARRFHFIGFRRD
jgi:hypothetical protein